MFTEARCATTKMSWFEPNTGYRIFSANRAGILPVPPKPAKDPNKKNLNMYLTLAGSDINRVNLTSDDGSKDGMDGDLLWYFRPADGTPNGNWTIHHNLLGERKCLERTDMSKGVFQLTNYTRGKPNANQRWFIKTELLGSTAVNTISEGSTSAPTGPSASSPAKIDIAIGEQVLAKRVALNQVISGDIELKLEDTKWCIQYGRLPATGEWQQLP